MKKRVIVIGAGTAGLCAAKNALENNFEEVVCEQTKNIGGLWNYTDERGCDEFGVPYGYMYQGLRTNAPKELMRFTDYDVKFENKSFLTSSEVLEYLHSYAKDFQVPEVIRFQHQVIRLVPIEGNRWEVLLKDLVNGQYYTETFDYAMVCNGQHYKPIWPQIKGHELFKGSQTQSFEFKTKADFKDKRVLIVGSGPSALDITVLVSDCATETTLAHHIPASSGLSLTENIQTRPEVVEITETGAIFKDGTECSVDAIVYCTGFNYSFPFLSTECGIYVDDNYVQPLFKQTINIKHPSMAIIGINFLGNLQMHFDIQTQFALKMWSTGRDFPSPEDMLKDTEADLEKRLARGWTKKHAHRMGDLAVDYYRDLAEWVEIRGMPIVYMKLFESVYAEIYRNNQSYRNNSYKIIDDKTFEKYTGRTTG